MVNIFQIPKKTEINCSMNSKSFMIVGKSKAGKSTLASQAPRPVFLMTENGGEALTGFTPVPIASWSDFKSAVNQLCTPQGRESFDSVVIDTYTNLILLLDKYIGSKMTTEKQSLDFGSDADYGKGSKGMKNELGIQLQKLANQGYLILNIVHAEDKVDFDTQRHYIGTSLSNSLYGVAEKFVDQIIYLKKEENRSTGKIDHKIWFNSKGGFAGAGGRWTPDVDCIDCSYANLEKTMLKAMEDGAKKIGAVATKVDKPSVAINEEDYDFVSLKKEFQEVTEKLLENGDNETPIKIKGCVESVLGGGKRVGDLGPAQAELLAEIISTIKDTFDLNASTTKTVVKKQES